MLKSILSWGLLVAAVTAAPTDYGLKFEKRSGALPVLNLPYGAYKAASYDAANDVSVQAHG